MFEIWKTVSNIMFVNDTKSVDATTLFFYIYVLLYAKDEKILEKKLK